VDSTSVLSSGPHTLTKLFLEDNKPLKSIQDCEWNVGMRTQSYAVANYSVATNHTASCNIWIYVRDKGKTCTIELRESRLTGSQSALKLAWLAEGHLPRAEEKARRMVEVLEECMERELSIESVNVTAAGGV
jgi:hypothetical protein